eukprot:508581-Ditylum_brightwellii.AAC.1
MAFLNHDIPYHVYTNKSDHQLGAAILQNGRSVAYWSCKLTAAQRNYTTMEKELLSIVSCFKEFCSILLGADITIYMDHKNLTFRTLSVQQVLRWRISLEKFGPKFEYFPGKSNVLADCFLCLPGMDKPLEGKRAPNRGTLIAFKDLKAPTQEDKLYSYIGEYEEQGLITECRYSYNNEADIIEDEEMWESFLNHSPLEEMRNPITMLNIQQHQFQDLLLNQLRQQRPKIFQVKVIDNRPVI